MAEYLEDENASFNRPQLKILNGRKLDDLSARERLDFANAAPRPHFATPPDIPECYQFIPDPNKLSVVSPEQRLTVANESPRLGRLRRDIAATQAALDAETSAAEKHKLHYKLEQMRKEAARLYAGLSTFELKRGAA